MAYLFFIFVIPIVTIISVKLYKIYKTQRQFHECLGKFPGDKWYPVVGTGYRLIGVSREDSWDALKGLFCKFGPTFRFWMDWVKPVIFTSKVEHAEIIFKHNVNVNKAIDYELFKPWLGQGLFTAHGQMWRKNRSLLTPAFHFKILDKYSEVFSTKANELCEIFEEKVGHYTDILPYVTNSALEIVSEAAMGKRFDSLKDANSEYISAIYTLCESVGRRADNPFYMNDFIFSLTSLGRLTKKCLKVVKDANMKVIHERRQKYKNEKKNNIITDLGVKQKLAFLDILLEQQEQNGYSDEYLCDEVSTFMFAGQDTTAATVTYILLALGCYPDIQAKVYEELITVLGNEQRLVTHVDIVKMEYLDRVIKESLRKFSIAPMIGRLLDEEITLDGVQVPPGVTVYVSLWHLHHDPLHWPDPDKFDPDRFLPENSTKRYPYVFAPFSAGPRNCIGQKFGVRNVKIMIATILKKFRVKCLEDPESIREYFEVVLRPQNGVHIKFELRDLSTLKK